MTKQRSAILDIIRHSAGHMTADDVFLLVKKRLPGIVMATVYNNLNALCDAGEIRRVHVSGRADRFDRTLAPHDHLICETCGKIRDVDMGDLSEQIRRRCPEEVTRYELNLHYVCENCRAKD